MDRIYPSRPRDDEYRRQLDERRMYDRHAIPEWDRARERDWDFSAKGRELDWERDRARDSTINREQWDRERDRWEREKWERERWEREQRLRERDIRDYRSFEAGPSRRDPYAGYPTDVPSRGHRYPSPPPAHLTRPRSPPRPPGFGHPPSPPPAVTLRQHSPLRGLPPLGDIRPLSPRAPLHRLSRSPPRRYSPPLPLGAYGRRSPPRHLGYDPDREFLLREREREMLREREYRDRYLSRQLPADRFDPRDRERLERERFDQERDRLERQALLNREVSSREGSSREVSSQSSDSKLPSPHAPAMSPASIPPNAACLLVTGLSAASTPEEVGDLLAQYGRVVLQPRMVVQKGWAYAAMASTGEADQAINNIHQKLRDKDSASVLEVRVISSTEYVNGCNSADPSTQNAPTTNDGAVRTSSVGQEVHHISASVPPSSTAPAPATNPAPVPSPVTAISSSSAESSAPTLMVSNLSSQRSRDDIQLFVSEFGRVANVAKIQGYTNNDTRALVQYSTEKEALHAKSEIERRGLRDAACPQPIALHFVATPDWGTLSAPGSEVVWKDSSKPPLPNRPRSPLFSSGAEPPRHDSLDGYLRDRDRERERERGWYDRSRSPPRGRTGPGYRPF